MPPRSLLWALFLAFAPALAAAAPWSAADFVDGSSETTTTFWRQELGVEAVRISCKVSTRNTPQSCVDFIRTQPTPGISGYFVYVLPDTSTLLAYSLQYSSFTTAAPAVKEVGIDDFFQSYSGWYNGMPNASQFLGQVIDNLKSYNARLRFGITLYEDELDPLRNPYIDAVHLPPAVKAKFDYVHLFLHYRKNGPSYAQYVSQAKAWFPAAAVIAGVYPYDRIDYLFSCAQSDPPNTPCTQGEELDYFQRALDIQVGLLAQGTVAALEVFPGHFGDETHLFGPPPNDNLACGNIPRCVQNTTDMRDRLLSARLAFGQSAAPGLSAAKAFPNPFMPGRGHSSVSFANLPAGSSLRIFTLLGERVRELEANSAGVAVWDGKNDGGRDVASGVYLALIRGGGDKRILKVAVER